VSLESWDRMTPVEQGSIYFHKALENWLRGFKSEGVLGFREAYLKYKEAGAEDQIEALIETLESFSPEQDIEEVRRVMAAQAVPDLGTMNRLMGVRSKNQKST
jgi:hypothetical protein